MKKIEIPEGYARDPVLELVGMVIFLRRGGAYHLRGRLTELTYSHYVMDSLEHVESSGHFGQFLQGLGSPQIDDIEPSQRVMVARSDGDEVYPWQE